MLTQSSTSSRIYEKKFLRRSILEKMSKKFCLESDILSYVIRAINTIYHDELTGWYVPLQGLIGCPLSVVLVLLVDVVLLDDGFGVRWVFGILILLYVCTLYVIFIYKKKCLQQKFCIKKFSTKIQILKEVSCLFLDVKREFM